MRNIANDGLATWFLPQDNPQIARKRWIAAMKPQGAVTLDNGAARALTQGKSLLPAGVVSVEGPFMRGDPIAMRGPDGAILAQGLSRYTAAETIC